MSATLTAQQQEAVFAVADVLVPGTESMPSFRQVDPDFTWGARGLAVRPTIVGELQGLLDEAAHQTNLAGFLREMHDQRVSDFEVLSTYVLGAYVMVPEVRTLYGYPGQQQLPAAPDLAAEELSDEVFEGAMAYEGTYRDVDH